MSCLH